MQKIIKKPEENQYKFIIPLSMLFLTTLLVSALAVHRTISIGSVILPGGIMIYPLTYFFSDVITECYGYKVARQILWYGLVFQFVFTLLINGLLLIPHTPSWNDQQSFQIIFHPLIIYCIATSLGTFIGEFINISALSRWKILLKGKFFWLRSMTSTSIGEAVFTMIALPIIFMNTKSISDTVKIVCDAYLFKLIFGFLVIIPTTLLQSLLKKIEGIDIYDHGVSYNPFKLS